MAIGSMIGGGLLEMAGTAQQHIMNRENMTTQNNFNAGQSAEQRDWAERMSNTSYQRAVKDMEAAGLNPMLAYQQGGASTPAGSAASGSALGVSKANVAGGMQAAMTAQLNSAQVANIQANTRKTNADAANAEALVPFSSENAATSSGMLKTQAEKLGYEARTALADVYKAKGDVELKDLEINKQRELSKLAVEYQRLVNQGAKLGIPEKEVEAEFFGSMSGAAATNMAKILQALISLKKVVQ